MIVCSRCATHLGPGSQVCLGCGLPLGAEATPLAAPAIEASAPPEQPYRAPDNPWRQPESQPLEHAPVYETAPVAAAETEQVESGPTLPPETVAPSQAVIAAELATPATRGPLLAFDPLPPVAASANPDPYVTTSATAEPSIAVVPTEGVGVVRGIGQATEETLAVPAAYATFAPEASQLVSAYQPETGTADVVELNFPAVLTVAPPAAPVTSWPVADTDRRAAEAL